VDHAQELGYPDPANSIPDPDRTWHDQEEQIEAERILHGCATAPPFSPFLESPECQLYVRLGFDLPEWCQCDHVTVYYSGRATLSPALRPLDGADVARGRTPFFTTRWARRPTNRDRTVPGAWTGFFFGNVDPLKPPPGIRIFNTYNRTDAVLRIPLIVNAGSGIVNSESADRDHAVGAKRR
jgi:hypothetical protein